MTEVAQAALDGFELERAHLVVRDPSGAATREVAARQLPDDARHQRAQALACSLRNAQRLPAAERARAMPVQKGAHAQADELHLMRGVIRGQHRQSVAINHHRAQADELHLVLASRDQIHPVDEPPRQMEVRQVH